MKDFIIEKYPEEIAQNLYENIKDMDFIDYEEHKTELIADLENAIYYLKTLCENDYNSEYFRTFYKVLECIK